MALIPLVEFVKLLRSLVFTLELRDLPHKIDEAVFESVKEAVHIAIQAPLRDRFRELPEADMKEILHKWMFESGSYKSLPEYVALNEALEPFMERAQNDEFLAEKDKSGKRRRDDQDPPSPPDLDLSKRRRHDTSASGSSHPQAPQSSVWKKSDTREAPPSNNLILMLSNQPEWLKPISNDERSATLEPAWVIPSSYILDAEKKWANALATTYQAPAYNSLLKKTRDMKTFMHCKGSRQALSIFKMKAARYLDFGLELLIPKHMWINEVYTYDISASYRISHSWFNHQKFYIDRYIADSSHKAVRTHMRILSVVSIKAFSRCGYDYLKEITLRKPDYQEYTIAEKDFKILYPSDFEDLNMLLLQGHLNHRFGSDKRMLSTALNLTKLGWDAKGFEYKYDYIIIDSSRAVMFPVGTNKRNIMRFNEIYKFSNGTLTKIIEALDFRVKEYKVNRLNPDSRSKRSFETWNALSVVAYKILTTDYFREPNEHFISAFSEDGNPARANIKQALGCSSKLVGDLAVIDTSISDEDQALLLLTSLPSSYDNFVTTFLYGLNTLKLEGVLSTLNSKELWKMTEAKGDGGKGLKEDQVSDSKADGYDNVYVMIVVRSYTSERVEVYYECKDPFKSLKCLWVKSKSIAAIWLEKVVTPLIKPAIKEPFKSLKCLWVKSKSIAAIWLEKVVTPLIKPAIKGFVAASAVLKPKRLKVDKHGMSEPMSYYLID
uniref:Retrovirus-related Pol polyprotein from transposon TNT 1-94 n=1 Tax=Tanacetum cinerariifolium TaxID=118510 RepID=A0A6L2KV52_TANCI|nr:retrovirus-related Pol polyprotein from transposon TNT 1-94 [Tanacetum cinerariifolium]